MATRSVRSDVWQYFEKGSGNVVCKVCGEKCAYHGGTSNLRAHLERHHATCRQFKTTVVSEINARWSLHSLNYDSVPVLASFMDPRFKNLKFLSTETRDSIVEEIKQRVQCFTEDKPDEGESLEPPPKKTALDKLLGPENNDNQIEDHEVDQYLSEKPAARTTQPLEWWKHNSHRFPNMAELAKHVLCVPATSTPSERIFSKAGITVSKRRCNLKPKNVDAIIFLNHNMKFLFS